MQAKVAQYLNEIVSLTIMALMITALVSAQSAPAEGTGMEAPPEVAVAEELRFRHSGELQ